MEIAFRETNRCWANRMTDEGLYALGLLGSDRGFLKAGPSGVVASARLISSAWPADGVIPVLACLAPDEGETITDLHPVPAAEAIRESADGPVRIIVLAGRKTAVLETATGASETWTVVE